MPLVSFYIFLKYRVNKHSVLSPSFSRKEYLGFQPKIKGGGKHDFGILGRDEKRGKLQDTPF